MSLLSAFGKDGQNVGGKSTIVHSLVWLIALIASFSLTLIFKTEDKVLRYGSFCLLAVEFVIFHIVYFYCLAKDPDLLRTEKHVYDMKRLDRQIKGDDSSGMKPETKVGATSASSDTRTIEDSDAGEGEGK